MTVRVRLLAGSAAVLLAASLVPGAAASGTALSGTAPSGAAASAVDAGHEVPVRAPAGLARVLQDGLASLARATQPAGIVPLGGSAAAAVAAGPEIPVMVTIAPADRAAAESAIAALGGQVANRDPSGVEAYVPQRSLVALVGVPGVERIAPIYRPVPAATLASAVTLQGAAAWQASGASGAGVKVGIIDGGFSGIAPLLGVDLPATVHARCYTAVGSYTSSLAACDQGGEIHGTAVAEAVAAMAPGASLWIADPTSQDDLLATIDWMTSNGVRIINASWTDTGFEGPGDGTSPYPDTAYALVDRAVSEGALWVNAAGNSGDQGWIGPWREDANGWLEFSGTDTSNRLTLQGGDHVVVTMRWSDPWGHATDDYDLGLYLAGDPVPVATSTNLQNGTGDPVETLEYDVPSTAEYEISAHRHAGGAAARVQLLVQSESESPLQYQSPEDTLTAPADGRNPGMLVVGAVDVGDPGTVESYSGRGPTLDGRIKPDLVAADCADTRVLAPFCGTSESAPFVSGAAADLLSANPTWTNAQLISYLTGNATAIGSPVPNPNAGWGRLTLGPPPNVPAALRFADEPAGGVAGAALIPQPVVEIVDASGRRVTAGAGATLPVTLSVQPAAGGTGTPPGGSLSCTGGTTVAAVGGVARFSGCVVNGAETGVTIVASATGTSSGTSDPFDVAPASAMVPGLSLAPSSTVITWGTGVTLGVRLDIPSGGPPPDSRPIELQTSADAVSWSTAAALTADASGAASLVYRPPTNLWYRAVLPAGTDLAAAVSAPVRVVVRQLALLRPAWGTTTRVLGRGSAVTFTVTMRPSRPELPAPVAAFRIYALVSGRWVLAVQRTVRANASGIAALEWRFATPGRWYVRASAVPSPLNANSAWSPPDRVLVT